MLLHPAACCCTLPHPPGHTLFLVVERALRAVLRSARSVKLQGQEQSLQARWEWKGGRLQVLIAVQAAGRKAEGKSKACTCTTTCRTLPPTSQPLPPCITIFHEHSHPLLAICLIPVSSPSLTPCFNPVPHRAM